MTTKDYNRIKLVNGLEDAINQALANIHVLGLSKRIEQYQSGNITAGEFLTFIESILTKEQV